VRLNSEAREVLGHTPIGMLALRAGRLPLVNPAAFHFASGSLWMTTSRYAAKILSAKRDPRAAFMVDGGTHALLLRGALEVYDPLSVSSQVRAVLDGPAYFFGMAGYALKNAPYFAGYLLDMTHIPREWLPYNRVVLRSDRAMRSSWRSLPFPPRRQPAYQRCPRRSAAAWPACRGATRAGSRAGCRSSGLPCGRWSAAR